MTGVSLINRGSSLEPKDKKFCISQLLTRQELADMFGVPLKVTAKDVINGKLCYVVQGSFDPPIGGVIKNISMEFDKTTMYLLRARMLGEYQGFLFRQTSSHSYEFLGKPDYPLEVGRECRVIETETRITTMLGKTQKETKTTNYTYNVEGEEKITVPAGTFKCFKIVQYDDNGSALNTLWKCDGSKQYEVKRIDHGTGEVIELMSLNSDKGLKKNGERI
jgi:hypothetical protein